MEPLIQAYLEHLTELHKGMAQAVDGLTVQALDWTPGPEMNSLSVLVKHTLGAERFLIGTVLGRDPAPRDREAEFHVHGIAAAELKSDLAETLAHTRRVLEQVTAQDLANGTRVHPRSGNTITVGWILVHILSHAAQHLGHMEMTRHWWDSSAK